MAARAPWVPDSASRVCMVCQAAFSFFTRRRHHCRECGLLACYECSPHRHVCTGYTSRVRTCVVCHKEFVRREGMSADPDAPSPRPIVPIVVQDMSQAEADALVTSAPATGRVSISSRAAWSRRASTMSAAGSPGAQSSPAAGSALASAQQISVSDIFNVFSEATIMIIDTRAREDYQAGHVPRAINVPVSSDDVREGRGLAALEAGVSLADKRVFARRQRQIVIICGQASPSEEPGYLSRLLQEEGKVSSVAVCEPGFDGYRRAYPFLACAFKPAEVKTGRHAHIPSFPSYPNEILDGFLFLGSYVDAKNKEHLKRLGVSRVLNLSLEDDNAHPDDFTYLRLVLPDEHTEDITQFFPKAFQFLDEALEARERVLVHCHQGVSRSGTIVLAYLVARKGWSLKEALEHVRARRKVVQPNVGFWKQLGLFEESVLKRPGTIAECVDLRLMEEELKQRLEQKQKAALGAVAESDSEHEDGKEQEHEDAEKSGAAPASEPAKGAANESSAS